MPMSISCGVLSFTMRGKHILLKGERMPCTPGSLRRLGAAVLLAVLRSAAGDAAPGGGEVSWRDIESRIQYGYYTEDASALRGLEDTLAADESHEALHGYYTGLLAWRQAQLAPANPPAAGQSPSPAPLPPRCVTDADAAPPVPPPS